MSTHFASLLDQWPLALGWLAYAVVHSALAADRVKALTASRYPSTTAWYRLGFNLLSTVLLLPLLWWVYTQAGPTWWLWRGVGAYLINGVSFALILLLLLRGPGYDLSEFLGLASKRPSATRLRISDWHRYVRHPWYAVGMVFIWTRDMNSAWLVSCLCISAYFLIGARLEENKLIGEFGSAYRDYRKRVAGLIPFPGRSLTRAEAKELESAASIHQPSKRGL